MASINNNILYPICETINIRSYVNLKLSYSEGALLLFDVALELVTVLGLFNKLLASKMCSFGTVSNLE